MASSVPSHSTSRRMQLASADRGENASIILRTFAFAGLILGLIGYLATLSFQYNLFRGQVVETTQTTSRVFAQVFTNHYWPTIRLKLPPEDLLEPKAMSDWPGIAEIDGIVGSLISNTDVLKVKLYSISRLTLYSTEHGQIGQLYVPDHPGLSVALNGKPSGQLEHRPQFNAVGGLMHNIDVVSSYLPITTHSGAVEGVLEIYFDATNQVASANHNLMLYAAAAGLIGLAAYLVLLAVVWGAESGRRHAIEALHRARDAAEEASRAKSMFLANMSHELRTPLNAIIGFSETIRSGIFGAPANTKHADYLSDIHESAQYLLALINDLLDLSAVEVGKLELEKTMVAVADVAADALRTIDPMARQNKIELTTDVTPDLPLIFVDSRRLKQIFLNLFSNAIRHTPVDGRVSLRARADRGWVELEITDTGSGMTEAEIAKALAPFSYTDNPMVRRKGGSGLGLPLTRRLVELHGGTIGIAGKSGHGTTVTLRLPTA